MQFGFKVVFRKKTENSICLVPYKKQLVQSKCLQILAKFNLERYHFGSYYEKENITSWVIITLLILNFTLHLQFHKMVCA